MSSHKTDAAMKICMDKLTKQSSLSTLKVLINDLGFKPKNISNILNKKSIKITQLTSELENIKSLINQEGTGLKAQDITNTIVKGWQKSGKDKAEIPSVIKDLMAKKGLTYIEPPQLDDDSPASAKSSSKSKLQKAKPPLKKKHKESKEDSDATESDEPHESDSSDESYSSSSSSAKAKSKAKPKPNLPLKPKQSQRAPLLLNVVVIIMTKAIGRKMS